MFVTRLALVTCFSIALVGSAGSATVATDDATNTVMQQAALYGSESTWSIHRKNKQIGTHTVSFEQDGNDLIVNIESVIRVTVMKLPVYRFRYVSQEIWKDGLLTEVTASVTENGDVTRTWLNQADGQSLLSGPDGPSKVDTLHFATNHWHVGVLDASAVFNTITGESNTITITAGDDGKLATSADQAAIDFTRYEYSGDLQLESWYDKAGRWVGMNFEGDDGSRIEYRQIPSP